MPLTKKTWIIFISLAFASIVAWLYLSYPQMVFINFSIDRSQAVELAKDYVRQSGHDPKGFKTAVVFGMEGQADRYLQRTIGYDGLKTFLKDNDFNLFFWLVRFYKENDVEEFRMAVNPETGQITSFKHTIDPNAKRDDVDREEGKKLAMAFLQKQFNFRPENYSLKGDVATVLDNRTEYSMSWQKNGISIPWSEEPDSGTGKLLSGVTISGNDILSFSKNTFSVPDQFNRFLSKINNTGANLWTLIKTFYYILYISSLYFVITRRNHLAMHLSKKFYVLVATAVFIISILSDINSIEVLFFNYPTTSPLKDYVIRYFVNNFRSTIFFAVGILLPCLSGELIHFEMFKNKKEGTLLHYIRTSFFTRDVAKLVLLGYLTCFIMLGIQSVLIKTGETYWGVWTEFNWLTLLSTAYWPFLAAFTIGFQASFFEEIMYRMFSISFFKRLFKSTIAAAIIASMIWGFAHSNYPVYPMWFRGIEVSCLGFFLSFVYLRFGIIPVFVAHYLFDVFWNIVRYIFYPSDTFYFISCMAVFLLPLFLSLCAFIANQRVIPKPLRWHLTKRQNFNMNVLKDYLTNHPETFRGMTQEQIRKELVDHGWDLAIVDEVIGYPEIYDDVTQAQTA